MPERKITFELNEYYHIYNRGNSKQCIFHDEQDYYRFMVLLYISNSEYSLRFERLSRKDLYEVERGKQLVAIGAWTLMPNHFHILITPVVEKGISKFMQKITTAYSMYYNKKYKRTGSLFEGKFKAQHVSDDRYVKYLYAYIHLNCMKIFKKEYSTLSEMELVKRVRLYLYSSYYDYIIGDRSIKNIIQPELFPEYFIKEGGIEKDLLEWIMYRKDLDIK